MVEMEKSKGSVYQQWHGALLENYIQVLSVEIKKLQALPSSEFYIPTGDIDDLLELAEFFEIKIPKDEDLRDLSTFKKYLGKIKNKAKKTILEDLRPVDPYIKVAEAAATLSEDDVREMEGESA